MVGDAALIHSTWASPDFLETDPITDSLNNFEMFQQKQTKLAQRSL